MTNLIYFSFLVDGGAKFLTEENRFLTVNEIKDNFIAGLTLKLSSIEGKENVEIMPVELLATEVEEIPRGEFKNLAPNLKYIDIINKKGNPLLFTAFEKDKIVVIPSIIKERGFLPLKYTNESQVLELQIMASLYDSYKTSDETLKYFFLNNVNVPVSDLEKNFEKLYRIKIGYIPIDPTILYTVTIFSKKEKPVITFGVV